MNDLIQQREHFEKIADTYFQLRNDAKHLFLKKQIWEKFFSNVPIPEHDRLHVLEAMCGYAEFYEILRDHSNKEFLFDAFDFSEKMVTFAKERNPHINIWIQDITKFVPSAGSYDIICIIGGLHHVYRHIDTILKNINMSLSKNGIFINLEPTHNNLLFTMIRKIIYRKNSFFDADTERGFSTIELNTKVQYYGLNLVHQIYPGLLAYVLWYNPDAFPILNKGSLSFAKKLICAESKIWNTKFARFLSFATLSCYRKES